MLAKIKKKQVNAPEYNEVEKLENVDSYIFDINSKLPPENIIVSIQGKKCLSTKNVLVISGKPKSRKSVVAQSIIGAALSGKSVLGIEANISNTDKVVLVDTEQSKHDLQNSLQRMSRLIEVDKLPENFICYSVRQLNPHKIKQAISEIVSKPEVRLLVVDGALDLILNMNDILEVKDVLDFLKKILSDTDVALILIVHQSKTTNFTIGHLGSFLDRFAQTVLEVTKIENGNSEIKAQMMRSDADFKPYEFYYNFNTNNYSIDWLETLEVRAKDIHDYSLDEHAAKIKKVFSSALELTYKDFIKLLAREYQKSEYFAKQLVKLFYDNLLIHKSESGLITLPDKLPF
jgi:RecA-family ATPase